MAIWEGKKYKMTESDKFDDYLKALGVGFIPRKMANSATPVVTLKKDGDQYTLITASTFKTSEISFKLNEEFDEETMDGRHVKTVFTLDGNKLTQKSAGTPPTEVIREFGEKEMLTTMKVQDVVCTRKYVVEE